MVLNLYPELSIIVITSTLHKVLDLHTYSVLTLTYVRKFWGMSFSFLYFFFAIIADSVHNMEDGGEDRTVIGGKYLVFVSSRSVKMRGFSFLSLHAF